MNAANVTLEPSCACVELVTSSEGLRLVAYPDRGAYSIGWGHRGVPEGTTWTEAQADAALRQDLTAAGDAVKALVTVPLTQGQFDALCDFVFNLGAGSLERSTLLQMLNAGNYRDAGLQLLRWDDVDGKPDAGLESRRERECALWDAV